MYRRDSFKPPVLPYCFGTRVKQEDTQLMQLQEGSRFLGCAFMSTMVALVSVWQRLQQAAMDLGPEMSSEMILVIKELDGVASTKLGHALYLCQVL